MFPLNISKQCQLHAVSRTQQGRQREPSVKTLRSPLSAEFWRHCVLSGRTQRNKNRILSQEYIYIYIFPLNISKQCESKIGCWYIVVSIDTDYVSVVARWNSILLAILSHAKRESTPFIAHVEYQPC